MKTNAIQKDIEQFDAAVRELGKAVGEISFLWKDEKFFEFSKSAQRMVSLSKEVIVKGNRYSKRIDEFYKELEEV